MSTRRNGYVGTIRRISLWRNSTQFAQIVLADDITASIYNFQFLMGTYSCPLPAWPLENLLLFGGMLYNVTRNDMDKKFC